MEFFEGGIRYSWEMFEALGFREGLSRGRQKKRMTVPARAVIPNIDFFLEYRILFDVIQGDVLVSLGLRTGGVVVNADGSINHFVEQRLVFFDGEINHRPRVDRKTNGILGRAKADRFVGNGRPSSAIEVS